MTGTGLEGVVIGQTAVSKVFGDQGRLVYAGYEIEDLAENATFEEVCYLLWYGELPNRQQLEQINKRLTEARALPPEIVDLVARTPASTHPMAALRTVTSALASYDQDAEDMSPEANERKAIRLTSQSTSITAAFERVRSGGKPLEPRSDLSHAANFLYMLNGRVPEEVESRIIDVALTLHAEHGMNASTFAARVTVATLADMHSGVTSAIGTLKGPLHGGANERVMEMLQAIGEPERADQWVRDALGRKERIMGFGHRVYRTVDPRAPILRKLSEQLTQRRGDPHWLEISERIVAVMREEMEQRGKQIYPNVDFFSASVYSTLGIPKDQFTNLFACARMSGWTAHIIEQLKDNRLIRPSSEYIGPMGKKVVPLAERG